MRTRPVDPPQINLAGAGPGCDERRRTFPQRLIKIGCVQVIRQVWLRFALLGRARRDSQRHLTSNLGRGERSTRVRYSHPTAYRSVDDEPTFFSGNKSSQYEDANQYCYRADGVSAQAWPSLLSSARSLLLLLMFELSRWPENSALSSIGTSKGRECVPEQVQRLRARKL